MNDLVYFSVIELARDKPHLLPIIIAAYEEAKSIPGGRFAGRWVVQRAKIDSSKKIGAGLKPLTAYGILKKEGNTVRGGRRAYYSMPDQESVGRAIKDIKEHK